MNGKEIIQKLGLQAHPEGGFYKETYRSGQFMETDQKKTRHVSTAIYFLLEKADKSLFHRIQSDELWFFHQGVALEIVFIQNGEVCTIVLGNDLENGEIPQAKIPAKAWFAARLKDSMGYALVSCTVAPGFDFEDFELATRENLLLEFPHLEEIIRSFTK